MTSGKRVTPAQIAHYWALRAQGFNINHSAREAGFARYKAYELEKLRKEQGYDTESRRAENSLPAFRQDAAPEYALRLDAVCDEAQEALNDPTGARFAKRYAGIELSAWQQVMWQQLMESFLSDEREYLCVNAPPGLGKSTVLVIFGARLTCEYRDIRGLFMSRAFSLAERNTLRLRRMLERTAPFINGESTLALDFGRFRAMKGELWRSNEFIVEQFDGAPIEEKEPTWAAFGFDAEWLGNRLDILIGDDLDSSRTVRNMETVEGNRTIYDNELEPRVDKRVGRPGGLLVTAQQRLGPFDFSSHVLAKQILPEDDGITEDPDGEPMYRHVVFKAHYEDKCQGVATHMAGAPGWPVGCLLDPRQLAYRDLRKAMRNRLTFELVYQQNDMVAELGLVKRLWLDGGRDPQSQIMYPGCWDDDRDVWELPGNDHGIGNTLADPKVGVITVDPSASNYWAIEAWVFCGTQRYLLDLKREKLEAPDFLDWAHDLGEFTGIAEDWRHLFYRCGVPLSWVVVEMNAAQRFMLQYSHFHRWMETRGVQVIAHSTQRNKFDAEYGVQMLGPKYERGEIRLPGKSARGNPHHSVMRLVNEVLRYPNSATIDCVMSQWFGEFNVDRLYAPPADDYRPQWRPTWLVPTQ